MNNELFSQIAKELATKLNQMLNIPLVNEEDEQKFFEIVTAIILELVFKKLAILGMKQDK